MGIDLRGLRVNVLDMSGHYAQTLGGVPFELFGSFGGVQLHAPIDVAGNNVFNRARLDGFAAGTEIGAGVGVQPFGEKGPALRDSTGVKFIQFSTDQYSAPYVDAYGNTRRDKNEAGYTRFSNQVGLYQHVPYLGTWNVGYEYRWERNSGLTYSDNSIDARTSQSSHIFGAGVTGTY